MTIHDLGDVRRQAMTAGWADAGFAVYVHWPFCAAKCPYCDFNSHVRHQPIDEARYVAAFRREMAYMRNLSGPRSVTSVFLGGGTPSLMHPHTVGAILESIADLWHLPSDIEVTLEANPSSVEAARFRGYRVAGVNRVSLGVQALNDKDLRLLGRLHDVDEATRAIALAREIFPRMSFDLIYARPDQTVEAWLAELRRAIGHAADHMSLYQLTIEEDTPFFALHKAGRLRVPDGDLSADLYQATQEETARHGMPAYEVSNHARPGAESRHNMTYWRYGDYAGIGPGAHGRMTVETARLATATQCLPETWLQQVEDRGHGLLEASELDEQEQADEMMLMGLRLREGLDLARWRVLSGRDLDPDRVSFLIGQGMIEQLDDARLRCSAQGMLVLDAVVADLAS